MLGGQEEVGTALCQGGLESKENPWGSSKWLFLQSLGTAPLPG